MTSKSATANFTKSIRSGTIRVRRAEFELPNMLLGIPVKDVGLFVLTDRAGKTERLPFSTELNEALYTRQVRMASLEQEAMRFGEHLFHNVETATNLYGKACTDLAFLDAVFKGFSEVDSVLEAINQVPRPHANIDLDDRVNCQNFIINSINGIGTTLVVSLKYPSRGDAFAILVGAIVIALDKRFSIAMMRVLRKR